MAPRVGVTRWEDVPGETIERYWQRLREAGLDPIDLNAPDATPDRLAGLVLTGGVDIDPARYGAERHERVRRIDTARDEFELRLLQQALAADLPVLAICRGHQLLNVALGGALLQHIESGEHVADYKTEGFPSRSHEVTLVSSGRLAGVYGAPRMTVNSRHHQAVTTESLAPGLHAVAVTNDRLVEAVESERHAWVVGVQWHPEREEPQIPGFLEASRRLFAAFAAAVTSLD
jgi:putative glutamine amidotransferase